MLAGELGAAGSLALRCVERAAPRAASTFASSCRGRRAPSVPPPSQAPPDPRLATAKEALEKVFGKSANGEGKRAKELPKELERILGERSGWRGPRCARSSTR